MTAIKCLIVDDEPLAIDLVENFLTRMGISDISRCENGVDAFRCLHQEKYDLVFLDIEMPMLSGVELLKSLPVRPIVVITTAYRDYAVEGFELEVLDYLVKPFSFARFIQTMDKAGRAVTIQRSGAASSVPLLPVAEDAYLFLKADRQLIKVFIREIRYIESMKDYIRVNTTRGEWLCHQSLTDITEKLPAAQFFRLHRSYTVALDKIDLYRDNCVHINGKPIPVSRENRQELRQRLGR